MRTLTVSTVVFLALAQFACTSQRRDVGQTTTTSAELPEVDTTVDLKPPVAPVVLVGRAPREPGR